MPLEHHPLSREFPEYHSEMRQLLQTSVNFSRLAEEYQALDRRIYLIEDGRETLDELSLQGLKLQRVILKDEIAACLKQAGGVKGA